MKKKDLKLRILQLHRELYKDSKAGTVYIVTYSGKEHIREMEKKEQAKRKERKAKEKLKKLRESLQKFTATPTPCSKCGKREIGREYKTNIYPSMVSEYGFIYLEFLRCHCVGCGYEWTQRTKDKK